jgi:hypothetical protein
VECDGFLDAADLAQKFREKLGGGKSSTTIGISMRTVNNFPQDMLEKVNVKIYSDKEGEGCILDAIDADDVHFNSRTGIIR